MGSQPNSPFNMDRWRLHRTGKPYITANSSSHSCQKHPSKSPWSLPTTIWILLWSSLFARHWGPSVKKQKVMMLSWMWWTSAACAGDLEKPFKFLRWSIAMIFKNQFVKFFLIRMLFWETSWFYDFVNKKIRMGKIYYKWFSRIADFQFINIHNIIRYLSADLICFWCLSPYQKGIARPKTEKPQDF